MFGIRLVFFVVASSVALVAGSVDAGSRTIAEKQASAAAGGKTVYGFIRFYEGKGATQDTFCAETISSLPYHVSGRICKNDEAKSLKVEGLPAGTRIWVYDNPNCDTGDDWALITTLQRAGFEGNGSPIVAYEFEGPNNDPSRVSIEYHYQDGNLNGKVSCRIIDVPAP